MGKGKKVLMSKHRIALKHYEDPGVVDSVKTFIHTLEPGESTMLPYHAKLGLPTEVWEEMGKPTDITITVRPGDRLNV